MIPYCSTCRTTASHVRYVYLLGKGHKLPTIHRLLREEGLVVSRRGVSNFAKARRVGTRQLSKMTAEARAIADT